MKKIILLLIIIVALAMAGAIIFSSDGTRQKVGTAITAMGTEALDTATAKAKETASEAVDVVKGAVNSATSEATAKAAEAKDAVSKAADNATAKAKATAGGAVKGQR